MGKKKSDSVSDVAISRRNFLKGIAGVSAATALSGLPFLTACSEQIFDYVIVGAGPGGGPLAAKLARAGYTVALLEAGIDPLGDAAASIDPSTKTLYEIPAFVAATSEHPLLSWDFFVKHYSDPAQQARDSKYVPGKGVLYPRGSCLGGSAAHNFLVFTYPHDEDFNRIARMTGDTTWNAANMRLYFEKLERCDYCQPAAPGHGFNGYMPTNVFDPKVFQLYPILRDLAFSGTPNLASIGQADTTLDINHPRVAQGDTGAFIAPMHISKNVRVSVREYLKETQAQFPGKLFLLTGALAAKVVIRNRKAVGVEYMDGANLYAADKNYNPAEAAPRMTVYARKEVILSGGAFNTPQLLKLSGIGPAAELEKFGIEVVADLPGVGSNLQDRYEVTVAAELKQNLDLLSQCAPFQPVDPCLDAYSTGNWNPNTYGPFNGPYATNAIFGTRIEKSQSSDGLPDLFMAGLPIPFRGYFPGHSLQSSASRWTWLVLKAHTNNTAGTVTLRSADPRDTPEINFRYFEEGNDAAEADIKAVVEGVKLARSYLKHPDAAQHILNETSPGEQIQTDAQIRDYIRNEAWGHHASCSAAIGADGDSMAVLDSRFRVRGIKHLRVVDASAFPRIPGFFPLASILMISEKAGDAILEDV